MKYKTILNKRFIDALPVRYTKTGKKRNLIPPHRFNWSTFQPATSANSSILYPYKYILIWDIGRDSYSNVNTMSILDAPVTFVIAQYPFSETKRKDYTNKSNRTHSARHGLVQGFLTLDDQKLARRLINRDDLLIAYTDTKEEVNN